MLRILILLLFASMPTVLFAAVVIWALGTYVYPPLQPVAHSIADFARPVIGPFVDAFRGLLANLLARLR